MIPACIAPTVRDQRKLRGNSIERAVVQSETAT